MIESRNIVSAIRWLYVVRFKLIGMATLPILMMVGVFYYTTKIINILVAPLQGFSLYYLTPMEAIMTKFQLAFVIGLVFSIPLLIVVGIILFGSKLKRDHKILIYSIVPVSTLIFGLGNYFGYTYVLPSTLGFLISCGEGIMTPVLSAQEYVAFTCFMIITIGLIFELPLVLIALARIGLLSYEVLAKKRKIAILIIFVVLAVVTPTPDMFTLLATGLPMVLLYEISIWGIYFIEKARKKKICKEEVL